MDMGDMGIYQLFKTGGDTAVGGMMTKMPNVPESILAVLLHRQRHRRRRRTRQESGRHSSARATPSAWRCVDHQMHRSPGSGIRHGWIAVNCHLLTATCGA